MSSQIPVVSADDSPSPSTDAPPPGRLVGGAAEPRSMSRWLWIVYPLAMAAMSAVWGGVMQVLLGKQVATLVPGAAASAASLGIVTMVAAVSSVISQPLVGRLSDRTRTRFLGRRNVWIFGGSIVGAVGLVVMSQMTSTAAIAVT